MRILILLVIVGITGCASSSSRWTKAEGDWSRDHVECNRRADVATPAMWKDLLSVVTIGMSRDLTGRNSTTHDSEIYAECLRRRGWQEQPAPK